jgi:cell division protein FtsZ
VTILSSIGDGQPEQERQPVAQRRSLATPPPMAEPVAQQEEPEPETQTIESIEPEPVVEPFAELPVELEPVEEEVVVTQEIAEPEVIEAEQSESPPVISRPRKFAFPVPVKPVVQSPPLVTRKPAAEPRQETLQFEPVTRGRFEKSEPTIVDGQDLDVPTFLRRNVKVK